jgi:hypothetical protein
LEQAAAAARVLADGVDWLKGAGGGTTATVYILRILLLQ